MLPIGPLMIEHRLIERMIDIIARTAEEARQSGSMDPLFVDAAVDFIRVYADRTHHGKEEDILFRELSARDMSPDDSRVMGELIEEHKLGRRLVGELVASNDAYRRGNRNSLRAILDKLRAIAEFYPKHIQKEDKVFFPASMEYFTDAEKDSMLEEMWTFDRKMIHEKYTRVVESWE